MSRDAEQLIFLVCGLCLGLFLGGMAVYVYQKWPIYNCVSTLESMTCTLAERAP